MTIVYAVMYEDYFGERLTALFSTEQGAKAFIDKEQATRQATYDKYDWGPADKLPYVVTAWQLGD